MRGHLVFRNPKIPAMLRPSAVRSIRIIHKLRTAMALLVFAAVIAAGASLWWANHTGLPDAWRGEIEKALEAKQIYTEIGTLRYRPLRGIEATEVTVFSGPDRTKAIAHLQKVVIGVDRSKLARGEVRVEKLELTGGGMTLPVDPDDPNSQVLEVASLSGKVLMPGGRRLEVRDARGFVGGIQVEMDALLLGYRQRLSQMEDEGAEARKARRKMMARALGALQEWHLNAAEPPLVRIRVEGDMDDPRSVRADVSLEAKDFDRGDLRFSKLQAKGEMRGRLLVLDSLELADDTGSVKGRIEFDMNSRDGRFEAKSNLDLPRLLRQVNKAGALERITFQSRPVISASGDFNLPESGPPTFHVLGHLGADNLRMGEYSADRIDSDFSWDGTRFFLDRINVKRPDGYMKASILFDLPLVQYRVETDLKARVWKPLFKGQVLEGVLGDFGEKPTTWSHARLKGWFDTSLPTNWNATGYAEAKDISFRGVPVHTAYVKMALDHDALDFTDGKVDFDYTNYALRKAHGGPASGKGTVGRVKWDRPTSTIIVEAVDGDFWPAPLVRTFAANVADHLEQYRFHEPPKMHGEGAIGIGPGQKLTDLRIHASTGSGLDYRFAGADLDLNRVQTDVRVGPAMTQVRNLTFDAYGGSLRGVLDIEPVKDGMVKGEFDWTKVNLPDVSGAYGFDKKMKGVVTGRIEFSQKGAGTENLNGSGLLALEQSELFSVPVFGPLSPLISGVIGRKKAGFQEAEEAFCTFDIDKGVLSTEDFLTSTPSMVFTGDARADLNDMTLDMTMRMNARGLLGIITLPFKPFYGLFQFRGTGPIHEPKWTNVMFTSPPKRQEKSLMAPPRAGDLPDRAIEIQEDGDGRPTRKRAR
ncbi:MAG: hypothetical protein JWO82_2146 [Akkermansiaceae bacterium]|nr:hypothetical protein [Akkermansiaceae bacterium]